MTISDDLKLFTETSIIVITKELYNSFSIENENYENFCVENNISENCKEMFIKVYKVKIENCDIIEYVLIDSYYLQSLINHIYENNKTLIELITIQ